MKSPAERIQELLVFLYGAEQAKNIWPKFDQRLQDFHSRFPYLQERKIQISQHDAWLITYGDQIREAGHKPLEALAGFVETHLGEAINGVHLLPFFPFSSDDGFSVIDYRAVDPEIGSWSDITRLDQNFRLMFDAVINHISSASEWVQGFRQGDPQYEEYFLVVDPDTDLSMVVRPRALPLLTAVETVEGEKHVWTTFSDDQIDLNYANPQVLFEITDLLLYYVAHGAEIIRLDAIAYLWKQPGTVSIHLPQTHAVVKLWRAVLDAVAPGVMLITETNVPHQENVSYFGEWLPKAGHTDESQLVYQFPLAPLVVHTLLTGQAATLTEWANGLETPGPRATFFNFIASHDGIGVRPAEGLLSAAEIQTLVERTIAHGGEVSYKANPDGSQSVYELNITLYDLLNDPAHPNMDLDVRRFLASQAIMLSLAGIPGIYFHSMIGARNCLECRQATGRARSINRQKFDRAALEILLADPEAHHSRIFSGYKNLLQARRNQPAFHPAGGQLFPDLINPALFSVIRTSIDGQNQVLCVVNVSARSQSVRLELEALELPCAQTWQDLAGQVYYPAERGTTLDLDVEPYGIHWLTPAG